MHAFGFHHEQVRTDRNKYIEVNMDNIEDTDPARRQFKIQENSNAYGLPYDGGSIMHYSPYSFRRAGKGLTFKSKVNYFLAQTSDYNYSQTW